MTAPPRTHSRTSVRTAFVSDTHLGSRYCQADRFLSFLQQYEMQELYLVGDILDGWRLQRRWRWPKVYHAIMHRLLELQRSGTRLYYTPGNHDEFLRHYLHDFGIIQVQDEFIHHAEDGRRFLVMHGDKFDQIQQQCRWLSTVGASLYEFLLWTNFSVNRIRNLLGLHDWHYCGQVKMQFKTAVNFISDFEAQIATYAQKRRCEAVICGHIHKPTVQHIGNIVYCNTGDWVEHCTAIVEHLDGAWELAHEFAIAGPRSQESFSNSAVETKIETEISNEIDSLAGMLQTSRHDAGNEVTQHRPGRVTANTNNRRT